MKSPEVPERAEVGLLNHILSILMVFHQPPGQVVCFTHKRQHLTFEPGAQCFIIHPRFLPLTLFHIFYSLAADFIPESVGDTGQTRANSDGCFVRLTGRAGTTGVYGGIQTHRNSLVDWKRAALTRGTEQQLIPVAANLPFHFSIRLIRKTFCIFSCRRLLMKGVPSTVDNYSPTFRNKVRPRLVCT